MSAVAQRINDDMASMIGDARTSLVQVRNGSRRAGAGTIWHPDGLIVTNAHVVQGGPIGVTLPDGRTLPATVLASDPRQDLAALSVPATGLPAATIGDSRALRPGHWVTALGHPWGEAGVATAGVVIATGARAPHMRSRREWIVVNLTLRPGNSGGPLIDARGRLVGVNTMMTGPEVGMAIPVQSVKAFLVRVLQGRGARPDERALEPLAV